MSPSADTARTHRIPEITWIRAICTLGIVCFHFMCYTNSPLKSLMFFANGYVGEMLVTVFFTVSGMLMRLHYPEVTHPGRFWLKRWKSIFPAFYLCFGFFFLENAFHAGCLLYEPDVPAWRLILTVLGLDGYLYDVLPNYYICGEWFLGAILVMYALYPLLAKLCRNRWVGRIGLVLLCAAFLWQAYTPVFRINGFRNLIGCLFSFCVGMACADRKAWLTKPAVWLSCAAAALFTLLVKLPVDGNVMTHVCGFATFGALYGIGTYAMKVRSVSRFCTYIGGISFPIYLVQHKIIHKVQGVSNPRGVLGAIIVLGATTVLTLACAQALHAVTERIMKGKTVSRIDAKLFGTR